MYSVRKPSSRFDPKSKEPYRLSRSRIDRFLECPRCFWLDERFGIKRPDMPGFSLNNAVDTLLKKEFDIHRGDKTVHPLLKHHGLTLVPLTHSQLEVWRDSLRRGIEFHHKPSNFSFRGGVDDVWTDEKETLYIVDYKATATEKEISLDDEWKQGYKRQMEMYQWLFRQNGYNVSNTGYFVFVNGKSDRAVFDGKLEFDVMLVPYEGNDSWVEDALMRAKKCLMSNGIPAAGARCDYCPYREAAGKRLLAMREKGALKKEKTRNVTMKKKDKDEKEENNNVVIKVYEKTTASLF